MKTLLLIAVIVCSVFAQRFGGPGQQGPGQQRPGQQRPGQHGPHKPGQHGHGPNGPGSDADRHLFRKCVNETGINREELEALREAAADASLSSEQTNFVCCLTAPLISDQQLNTTSVQNIANRPGCDESNVELSTVISSCESDGVTANTLDSCENIAPFMHCVYTKLREECRKPELE